MASASLAQVRELVGAGRVDGLLIASARPGHPLLAPGALAGVPHVFTNRVVPGSGRNVPMDDAAASAVAVQHLVAAGHRRIGHVAGPRELQTAQVGAEGFVAAAGARGLDAAPVVHGEFSEAGGAAGATELLAGQADVTALYVSTLPQAVGVLHALREQGLDVPGDISVIAYDDMPLAGYLDPPLTTIAMPLRELGSCVVGQVVSVKRPVTRGPVADGESLQPYGDDRRHE